MPTSTKTYVRGTCKKCGATIRVEVNGQPVERIKEALAATRGYECPGQHIELGILLDGYTWNWTPVAAIEPPTDEEFGRTLITKYGKDHLYYMGDDAIGRALDIPRLQTLRDLEHMGFGDFTNATHYYRRVDTPRMSTRFYIKQDR